MKKKEIENVQNRSLLENEMQAEKFHSDII